MTAVAPAVTPRAGVDRRGIAALSCGHGGVDLAQGAVPALPFLIHQRGYSYAAASGLVLAMTLTSSLFQPPFGHLADRRSLPLLLPGGVLLAGLGIALAGVAHSYLLTFTAVALSCRAQVKWQSSRRSNGRGASSSAPSAAVP